MEVRREFVISRGLSMVTPPGRSGEAARLGELHLAQRQRLGLPHSGDGRGMPGGLGTMDQPRKSGRT